MDATGGFEAARQGLKASADEPVIISAGPEPLTGRALRADVLGLRRRVPRGGKAAVVAADSRVVAAAFVALEGWAARVELAGSLDPALLSPDAVVLRDTEILRDTNFQGSSDQIVAGAAPEVRGQEAVRTAWRLFSSGTTGTPKPTDHSFASLTRSAREGRRRAEGGGHAHRRWGLLYPPTRMAGVQVVLQAVCGGDSLVDAHDAPDLEERLRRFVRSGVDSLSATPTVWRMILRSRAGRDLRLRQMTLGGEIATQSLLDALNRRFSARLTHVYASTEAGAVFSVSDSLEGFPRDFLERGHEGIVLKVHDGVLFVYAPESSKASPDGFVCTGDIVEVRGDRVHFLGRVSGLVNVGGDKVLPERVEEILRQNPAVADALVIPRPSRITGWVLTAEVVSSQPGGDLDSGSLESALRSYVAQHLPRSHVPARVKVVSVLSLSPTGKASRA